MKTVARWTAALILALAAGTAPAAFGARRAVSAEDPRLAERIVTITRATPWRLVSAVPLRFKTFHPQGMVKIGDDFYLSAVEVQVPPKRDGLGDAAGAGVGHLFRFGADGVLKAERRLGEGALYHPGGIDYDGRRIWAPVSEYRPDSAAILYEIDPATLKAEARFRFPDHIGAVAFDRRRQELRGFGWGSRRSYRWPLASFMGKDRPAPSRLATPNPFNYIDFQDCHYAGAGRMLCSGIADYPGGAGAARTQVGGLELIDLGDDRPLWQLPVAVRSAKGRLLTQNPFFVEATRDGLRAYFIPDDDESTLYVYDIAPVASAPP